MIKLQDNPKTAKTLAVIKLMILIILIVGIPTFLYFTARDTIFNKEWLANLPELLAGKPKIAGPLIIICQIIQVIICFLPGQPIQVAASYIYGVWQGYLLSIAGGIIGGIISFFLAKLLGRESLQVLFGQKQVVNYLSKMNSGKGLYILFLIYLLPGVPKDLMAYVAGVSEVRFLPYIIISTIGRSPGMIGSLLVGHYLSVKNYFALGIIAIIAIAALIFIIIKRKAMMDLLDRLEKSSEKSK